MYIYIYIYIWLNIYICKLMIIQRGVYSHAENHFLTNQIIDKTETTMKC